MKWDSASQRWLFKHAMYRPPAETIRTREYDVAPIAMAVAKDFVLTHHYSGSYPACRFRFGLFHRGSLVGVAVFSMPMSAKVLTNVFPWEVMASVELGRFVLLDEVPGNGESWFFARCRELLRAQGIKGVVAFSDDVPRTTVDGREVFAGHIGLIYQASNGTYLGRGSRGLLRILPDASVFSHRAVTKIRKGDTGWNYAVQTLVRYGAAPPTHTSASWLAAWLERWLPRLTRPLRHPGCHKYAWSLTPNLKTYHSSILSLTYPKRGL